MTLFCIICKHPEVLLNTEFTDSASLMSCPMCGFKSPSKIDAGIFFATYWQNFDRKQSLFSTFGRFYDYLGISPPLLKKTHFFDHIIKCGLEISSSLFTAAQNLKSQTSNRRGFFRGGIVSTLRRSSRFKPFFLRGDFSNHHRKLFFAFFSCVGVDIKLFAFAVGQFRRIASFPFLFADSKYVSRAVAAYLRLFRLKFRSYGSFRRSVGCLSVLAQSALIFAEIPFNFVGGGALHIGSDMGIYVQRRFWGNMSYDRRQTRIIRTRPKRRIFGVFSFVVFIRRKPYRILRIKIHTKIALVMGRWFFE